MTIVEYQPSTVTTRLHHRREIRRMTDGVMPRNTLPAMLLAFVLVLLLFFLALCLWWNAGAMAEEYTRCRVTAETYLRVRTGPGIEYRQATIAMSGAELILLDSQNGWALVSWPASPETSAGWVSSKYIEVHR